MIELRLPSFGADMDTAEFVQWRVEPGQAVKKGAIACVVETDKGAIDVEVWQDGTVARLVAEAGQRLPVGAPLALLAEAGEDWHEVARREPAAAAEAEAAPSSAPTHRPAPAEGAAPRPSVRASPAARRRAGELGVDLAAIAAGHDQPVTLDDVERTAAAGAELAPARAPAPHEAPERGMRGAIAAAMARSKREIPHYYLGRDVDVESASQWLEAFNATRAVADRVLFAAVALRAVALALRDAPLLNGTFADDAHRPSQAIHLGVVTALRGGGLVVPTVHDADRLDLDALMRHLRDALARARGGRLRSSDLADATLTVTNLGDLGTDTVYGVIYPPQVALVGLGRVLPRPVVRDGAVVAARTMHVSLAADHRVSDGLVGARFLGDVADRLARPQALA